MQLENSHRVITTNPEKLDMEEEKPTKPVFVLDTA